MAASITVRGAELEAGAPVALFQAHITGGGLPGNLPRVLPQGTKAVLTPSWPVPPVFGWLARTGGVAPEEMLRVFNCGIGMVVVVPENDTEMATYILEGCGERVMTIGRIIKKDSCPIVRIRKNNDD